MPTILVIEDEKKMREGLRDNLEMEGYAVECTGDGGTGLDMMRGGQFDLVILDVMLPGLSGFEVLKKARAHGVLSPVLMLTARGEEVDKVLGLELGADDYVVKPFSLRELLARVKAILRRAEGRAEDRSPLVEFGDVAVDFAAYSVRRSGKPVEMTPKEIDILKCLWKNRSRTVTRDQLLTEVWGYDEALSTRTVDNFIVKLRQKLEADPRNPKHILTIHGLGYKFIA
jgi:DNA-binding response OmpR family regulator